MATDLERLVVQMSADLRGFENAMAKATGVSRAQLKQLRDAAANTGNSAETAFDGAARGVRAYGNSASAAARQAGALRAQTGNLAAQFQDIAVQLQMGQNPFQIALQQGTQISAVLGGSGALGAVKALGGAFASLISPVSLVTIGLIAAGGAAVQYFSGLMDDGEKSADELKKQSDLIRQVAKDWGDAVPSLKAYADELERATKAENLREAGQSVVDEKWSQARDEVAQYAMQVAAVETVLQSIGDTDGLDRLRKAFQELQDKVEDQKASGEDATRVQEVLNTMLATGGPIAESLAGSMTDLAGSLDTVANSAAKVSSDVNAALDSMRQFRAAEAQSRANLAASERSTEQYVEDLERRNTLTAEQIRLEDEAARIRADVERSGGVLGLDTSLELARQTLAAEERRAEAARAATAAAKESRRSSGGGGGGSRVSEIDREREAVTKLIETLQFEQSLIGMTNEQKEVQNALRRAGSAATDEERAKIEQIVSAAYAQNEALRQNEEHWARIDDLRRDVLGGIAEDLREGISGAELLSNALNRVAESFINIGLDQLSGAMRTGGGAGGLFGGRIIPGILHGGGTAGVDGYGHGRSFPASTWANAQRFHTGGMVGGLRAGEVPAILQKGETVIPRGGSGGTVQVQLSLTDDIDARIVQVSGPVAVQVVKRTGPGVMADAQRRSG